METLFSHIYKVWKPYSPIFIIYGNLIPHIYWGWIPYSPILRNPIYPHLQRAEPYSPNLLRLKTSFPHFYKVWKPHPPKSARCGNLIHLIYKVWKPYSPILRMGGNLILPHLQGMETIFPHIYNLRKPYSPHLLRVDPLFPNFYKVWNPYSPTFTRCGNLIPPHLLSVETSFPIPILKVWLISQDDISMYAQYVPLWTQPKMLLHWLPSTHYMIVQLSTPGPPTNTTHSLMVPLRL